MREEDDVENDTDDEATATEPRVGKTYDVTREIRRLALEGRLRTRFPQLGSALWEALCDNRRIWFSEEYQDYSPDPNRRRRRRTSAASEED